MGVKITGKGKAFEGMDKTTWEEAHANITKVGEALSKPAPKAVFFGMDLASEPDKGYAHIPTPTHRCTDCGTLWTQDPNKVTYHRVGAILGSCCIGVMHTPDVAGFWHIAPVAPTHICMTCKAYWRENDPMLHPLGSSWSLISAYAGKDCCDNVPMLALKALNPTIFVAKGSFDPKLWTLSEHGYALGGPVHDVVATSPGHIYAAGEPPSSGVPIPKGMLPKLSKPMKSYEALKQYKKTEPCPLCNYTGHYVEAALGNGDSHDPCGLVLGVHLHRICKSCGAGVCRATVKNPDDFDVPFVRLDDTVEIK